MNSIARAATLLVASALAIAMAAPGAGANDDGTTAHLWDGHLKPMRQAGTINDSTNPVDWTKLKNVPAGIADGTDDGVQLPGFGLKKLFDIFLVDTKKVQRRITTTCGEGQSIRAIASNGSATCNAGPHGVSLTIADTGPMCNNDCTEGTLVLTAGTWMITGQIVARQSVSGESEVDVTCHLDAGGKKDEARFQLETWGAVTVPMQLITTLTGNLHATINCGDLDVGEMIGSNLSIVAIRLAD